MTGKELDSQLQLEPYGIGHNRHSRCTISVGDWIGHGQRLPSDGVLITFDITQHSFTWRKRAVRRLHLIADLLLGMTDGQRDVCMLEYGGRIRTRYLHNPLYLANALR